VPVPQYSAEYQKSINAGGNYIKIPQDADSTGKERSFLRLKKSLYGNILKSELSFAVQPA
jgi:hypothetical protein